MLLSLIFQLRDSSSQYIVCILDTSTLCGGDTSHCSPLIPESYVSETKVLIRNIHFHYLTLYYKDSFIIMLSHSSIMLEDS